MPETNKDIIIPSTNDITAINQKLGGTVLNINEISYSELINWINKRLENGNVY